MTPAKQDRLYQLLPALYRELDERQGQPLRALMAVLESEFARLEEDMGAMYDDWFIETCDLWVVPYIADLLGVRHLQDMNRIPRQRRLVANSIAYRRRKGTLAVLEHVIRDATGWCTRSVEFAHLVASTQHVAHTQPDSGRTVDVRQLQAAAEIDGPLDTLAHTLDVDNSDQGRYNLDRIGLFLCRLRSYPIRRSFARPIEGNSGCFTFDPLGRDIPLFNQPRPVVHISQRAEAFNLPLPISLADLAADLQEHRARYGQIPKGQQPTNSRYYGPDGSLYIELPGGRPAVKPSAVVSMDLSQWPAVLSLPAKAVVAVDVELGRIAFVDQKHLPDQVDLDVKECAINMTKWPSYVIVNYNYGFSSEVGGGPYRRELPQPRPAETLFQINVAKGAARRSGPSTAVAQGTKEALLPVRAPTLGEALEDWDKHCAQFGASSRGIIRILDNGVYDEALEIKLPKGAHLSIVADTGVCPIIGKSEKPIIVYPDEATKAHQGTQAERQLHLNGLLLHGGLQIGSKEPEKHKEAAGGLIVTLEHCSLVTTEDDRLKLAGIEVALTDLPEKKGVQGLEISIEHSILGPLYLPATTESLRLRHSIVDNGSGYAIAAGNTGAQPGPALNLERATIFGQVHARKVTACDVIFSGPLNAPAPETRDQMQHSYVPVGSTTLEGRPHPSISTGITPPRFTSTRYGDPAYAQLSLDCPRQIRGGAADGSEMGAFHELHQLQAEANLRAVLDEYLPLGLRAGIFYVT
jgi:hypothetical protein